MFKTHEDANCVFRGACLKDCECEECEINIPIDEKPATAPVDSQSAGWVCTVAVPFQALNMAQLLLTQKAKETQNADLLRMVAELEEFEQKLLYSDSKPNAELRGDCPGKEIT